MKSPKFLSHPRSVILPIEAGYQAELERLRLQLQDREEKIRSFRLIDAGKERALRELSSQLEEKERLIESLKSKQEEQRQAVEAFREEFIRFSELAQRLETQLNQIQSSNGWNALQLYYRLREQVFPPGSRRRRAVRILWRAATRQPLPKLSKSFGLSRAQVLMDKFVWYCRIYGFKNAFKRAFQKFHTGASPSSRFAVRPLSVTTVEIPGCEENLPLIDKKISVVIPVKNGGEDFRNLLKKIKAQKGLRECEIVVVDSESTDGSVEVARQEGATVVQIPPDSFTHAYARNRGAECATGKYLLFIVQDALPLTDTWLWEMAHTLERNDVAAVSCAEYPRSDCDLFYQHIIWNHNRALRLDRDRFLSWDSSCLSDTGLRSNAQISDIAALITREVFEKYKFRTSYAEDLDLGIRLIKDGHRIGFLYSTRVLHSHRRSALYFLKRGYVDAKFLNGAFPNLPFPAVRDQQTAFRDIVAMYSRTNHAVAAITDFAKEATGVRHLIDRIRRVYSSENGPDWNCAPLDREGALLGQFVGDLTNGGGVPRPQYSCRDNMLVPRMFEGLGLMEDFLLQSRRYIDEQLICELKAALYKLFALCSGAHLAYLYLTLSTSGSPGEAIVDLDRRLTSGV